MNKNIAVFGGFKNATSTLQLSFNCKKYHDLPFQINQNEFNNFEFIIIPFRKNEQVYPSAFFQDIIVPVYGYSPFSKGSFLSIYINHNEADKKHIILNTNVNDLYDHYIKINWDSHLNLNNKMRLNHINNHYKINLNYDSNDIQVLNTDINNKNRTIICFNCELLNQNFNKIKNIIFKENNNIKLLQSNIGASKWYKNKYSEFITLLKNKINNIEKMDNIEKINNVEKMDNIEKINNIEKMDNIWYAYKNDWHLINNKQIKAKKDVFIKNNKDVHSDELDNNSKKKINANKILTLSNNQNNNKYYIVGI